MLVVFIIQLKYIHELDMMFNMMVDEKRTLEITEQIYNLMNDLIFLLNMPTIAYPYCI